MAKTKELPIYKVSYELLKVTTEFVRNFSRDFRPSLGQRLHAEVIRLVLLVYRANAAMDKREHLTALLETLEVVETLLQLACDLRLISRVQFSRTVPLTTSIGDQAGGWRKRYAA